MPMTASAISVFVSCALPPMWDAACFTSPFFHATCKRAIAPTSFASARSDRPVMTSMSPVFRADPESNTTRASWLIPRTTSTHAPQPADTIA
ncbi:hypothetical protein CXR34_10630 [Microbacterium hominis]|uniref:Secreted protein n=1 Tax=Microbacterium hominis TaxID=162426 RepID=A0A2K9DVM9_9MICO|nr:hypothetical protein CXR34_10630 [Microbacterium hominis]